MKNITFTYMFQKNWIAFIPYIYIKYHDTWRAIGFEWFNFTAELAHFD